MRQIFSMNKTGRVCLLIAVCAWPFGAQGQQSSATLTWAWISGDKTQDSIGYKSAQGVADVQNRPSARSYHSMVFDKKSQSWYIFGGLSTYASK